MFNHTKNIFIILFLLFTIAGCGGGSSSKDTDVPVIDGGGEGSGGTGSGGTGSGGTGSGGTGSGGTGSGGTGGGGIGGGGIGGGGSGGIIIDYNPDIEPADDDNSVRSGVGQTINSINTIVLNDKDSKVGELHVTEFSLPNNLPNARENTGTSHYNGRTAMRYKGSGAVKIPIRSYVAHCTDKSGLDKLFVSLSLQEGKAADDRTGSVYQLQLNTATNAYEPTSNSVILTGVCNETHGVAVSDDCSRVAVLCETEHRASETSSLVKKDIAKESGIRYFNQGGNGNFINGWSDISEMMDYAYDIPGWQELFKTIGMPDISEVLSDLQKAFPKNNYDENTTYKTIDDNQAALQVVEESAAVQANRESIINGLRKFHYSGRDEMWLLEWNNETLADPFDAYVVAKNAGNSVSSMNLLYVEDDSKGITSYAFTAETTQFFGAKNGHTAAAQFIIDRGTWNYALYNARNHDGTGRGWEWNCMTGHDFLTRTLYNPYTELFASLCTSDTTRDGDPSNNIGGGHLGTIGIKRENVNMDYPGRPAYYVPSTGHPAINGGGHTVVPINGGEQMMMVLVAPQLVTESGKEKYMPAVEKYLDYRKVDYSNMNKDEKCLEYHIGDTYGGCDNAIYFSDANDDGSPDIDIYVNSSLWAQALDPRYYSRVGIRLLDSTYKTEKGTGMIWLAGDVWDIDSSGDVTIDGKKVGDGKNGTVVSCTYGAPQLVDLENGRYLVGFAKYICSDHKFNKDSRYEMDNYFGRIGGTSMLFPSAYYLVEIDASGNILEGPVELKHSALGDIGWGSIDEIISLGDGKAGWVYKPNPTTDTSATPTAPSPLSSNWRVMVYESSH